MTGQHPRGAVAETAAKQVRAVRKERRMSQVELADRVSKLGVKLDQVMIARIESLGRKVCIEELVALSAALDVSPIQLLLPSTADADELVAISPKRTLPAGDAWDWMRAVRPLPPDPGDRPSAASLPTWLANGDTPHTLDK